MGYPPTQPRTFAFGWVLNRLSTQPFGTNQIVLGVAYWFCPRISPKQDLSPALSEEEQELKTTFLCCAI
jgi:hypothetical protein